ncbi:hypothetical protein [Sphingobacterium detergens]|uniref:Uncharacterized protein n=1 Tax=Sphingobacterium detergens TaxID=1145106 RepID=A0A420BF82_SPHD1|nr:hypothetical protein [Sphingobacterium detergens]RKE55356.1 hypothetical protein DFQ12_0187 [Sphingobacterium detergens]
MEKKLGLKIELNGSPVTNAGLDKDDYVLIANLNFVERKNGSKEFSFNVSGMDGEQNDHLYWYGTDLKEGDTITMEVIEAPFDEPKTRTKSEIDKKAVLKDKLDTYYHLKEKLKDHIK